MKNGGMRWVSNSTAGISFRQFFNSENSGSDYYSFLGGNKNLVTGQFSAILGGNSNNDNGFSFAGIFGDTISAQLNNTMHVENLWMKPGSYCHFPGITTSGGSGFPYGTVYIDITPGGGYPLRIIAS